MKLNILKKIALFMLAVAVIFTAFDMSALQLEAKAKSVVATPLTPKWTKSGKYQFKLTKDGELYCKKGKKTRKVSDMTVSTAYLYGTDVLYKTPSSVYIYEAKIDTSYGIAMKFAEGIATNTPISDVVLAGYGKGGIIYYSAPASNRSLYAFDYKAGTVDYMAGYINRTYTVGQYIFVKCNTSADANATGPLYRIDVKTGKTKVMSSKAISASFSGQTIYWTEPAEDYTFTLGIGTLKVKSCKVSDDKAKTIASLDDVDTNKTAIAMPKFVTCVSKNGVVYKYTYKTKKMTAYESYQQKDLMNKLSVLH